MTLNGETERIARELAELTGDTVEEAVRKALRDQLAKRKQVAEKLERIRQISDHFMSLPVLDPRTPEEILGYDEHGAPT